MDDAVIIRLLGGLGNQMFQYAAALGLAVHQGRGLRLDVSAFARYEAWPYQLDCLRVPQELCPVPADQGRLSALVQRVGRRLVRETGLYREPHFHFDPSCRDLSGESIILEGYFQSPRHFAGVEALLRERFQPREALTATAAGWAERIAASPQSVSIHVRRGDYLSASASAIHTTLDMGYYRRAVDLMLALAGKQTELFLFSDDPDLAASGFQDLPRVNIVRSDPAAPWEDMFVMAGCTHHIIANSSYSWWGAWLNPSPSKRVIAPAQWFTSDRLATTNVLDLYPDDWILLK